MNFNGKDVDTGPVNAASFRGRPGSERSASTLGIGLWAGGGGKAPECGGTTRALRCILVD
jgi:hypothetical protein